MSYEGQSFVTIEGTQNTRLEAEQIQALVIAIEDADFFSLENQYILPITDHPSVDISVTLHGRSKKIWHYGAVCRYGDRDIAPQGLCDFEIIIDKLVNSSQWVGQK